jgi:D-glycero-alpha-D-manno-heptose-7-phosphate kinase
MARFRTADAPRGASAAPLRLARARAPLRLGLAGGGTDLPGYAGRFGGAVLNTTIDRYAFASVAARADGWLVFDACDLERVERHVPAPCLAGSGLDLHRGVYERMMRDHNGGVPLALTVTTSVDAPLGSSSALVVALIGAYAAFLGRSLTPRETATLACDIERRELCLAGGRQDQYAAAYGGVNVMRFPPRGEVVVDRLRLDPATARELEASLVLSFSGQARASARIIAEQARNLEADSAAAVEGMHRLKEGVATMRDALLAGDLAALAVALDRSWQAKKQTARGIVTAETERLEGLARSVGAMAVKVSGAGGGGFAMCLVPPERRARLIACLQAAGSPTYPVRLTGEGSEAWVVHRSAPIPAAEEAPRAPFAAVRPSHPVPA